MSRYYANKLLRDIISADDRLTAFLADRQAYVDRWLEIDGHELSEQERRGIVERDYATLYSCGVHPFLLWTWTEFAWTPERPRHEVVRDYKDAVRPLGYPDFST